MGWTARAEYVVRQTSSVTLSGSEIMGTRSGGIARALNPPATLFQPCGLTQIRRDAHPTNLRAFARVKELVNTFKENEAFYTSSAYQEAEARKNFIDKFWIALGWDIHSEEEKIFSP